MGRPSILEVSVAISTVTICQQTSLNLRPRDLSSTCQSKKLHDTKNPPKSWNILELLYDVHVIMLSVSVYTYMPIEREHFSSTEFLQASFLFNYQGYQLQNHMSQQQGLTTKQPYR